MCGTRSLPGETDYGGDISRGEITQEESEELQSAEQEASGTQRVILREESY